MSACMSGSGVLSSTGDVLVRGVGGVFIHQSDYAKKYIK